MKTIPHTTNYSHLNFWASYWNISAEQLNSIITKIGSRSFLKIQDYINRKLSR